MLIDDVTDFEICAFYKSIKICLSRERKIAFSSNKKNHQLHIKVYFIAKNSFVAEVTFKLKISQKVSCLSLSQLEFLILMLKSPITMYLDRAVFRASVISSKNFCRFFATRRLYDACNA